MPSLAESLPYVILEGAAAGRHVISTTVGGIAEIFGPTAGSLVPPGKAGPLRAAMQRVSKEESGVVVILRPEESPRDFMDSVRLLDSKPSRQQGGTVVRTYGIGAQILKDLGLKRMRVLSARKQLQGLAAFDLEITSYVDGDD